MFLITEPKIHKAKLDRTARRKLQWTKRQIAFVTGDCNTPLSIMDKSWTQKISKDTVDLDNSINQLDSINWK